MNTIKRQAATLIASGMSPADTARQLSVTEGYISQIQLDDDYQRIYHELVGASKVASHSVAAEIDTHYNSMELGLAQLFDDNQDLIFSQMLDKPALLLQAITKINGLKRRSVGESLDTSAQAGTVVALVLPTFLTQASLPKVIHNSDNEVIEVDGTALVSLSGTAIKSQLAELKTEQLPAPIPVAEQTIDLANM